MRNFVTCNDILHSGRQVMTGILDCSAVEFYLLLVLSRAACPATLGGFMRCEERSKSNKVIKYRLVKDQ